MSMKFTPHRQKVEERPDTLCSLSHGGIDSRDWKMSFLCFPHRSLGHGEDDMHSTREGGSSLRHLPQSQYDGRG